MSKNILDSRDLAERLEELRSLKSKLENAKSDVAEAETEEEQENAQQELQDAEMDFGESEINELEELETLESELPEWKDGATLIHENYWNEYVEDLVSDDLPRNIPGYIVIDWTATANNVRAGYSEVTYLGETYLVRDC